MSSSRLSPSEHPFAADAPAGGTPEAVLDAAALARLAELDPRGESKLLQRVMTTFQNSAVRLRAQLEAASASGDREAIRIVAHTLKSSSGYIGALELSRCCAALEAAADPTCKADLRSGIEAMLAALESAQAAVSRRLSVR